MATIYLYIYICEYSHPPCLSQDVQMLRKVAACEAAACLETGDWVSQISPGYAKLFIIHVFPYQENINI